jgi:hypothetical protein
MRPILMLALLAGCAPGVSAQPRTDISNGLLRAAIYLPDTARGYYRSTRFDWAGVMPRLEYKGHNYFGQWFQKYDPTINDAIMGPVESFSPLGYEKAAVGGSFVMIGVGRLTRPDSSRYSPFRYYPIADAGTRKIRRSRHAVSFRHFLQGDRYSYVYTKKIELVRGKPEMLITHLLKNTGREVIETDVYDHNFFVPDDRPVGPGRVLKFPFALTAEGSRGLGELAAIEGDSIRILRAFGPRESVYAILYGYDSSAADYDIRLEDRSTGAGVRISADRPLSRLVCWGSSRVFCPEPYIHITIPPGSSFAWILRYEFYTL